MKFTNQTMRLLTLAGFSSLTLSTANETLMSTSHVRKLQSYQGECIGLIYEVQMEDHSDISGIACEFNDGQILHIDGAPDEIIAGFADGTYASGETIIEIPDASLDTETGSIIPGLGMKARKQERMSGGKKSAIGDYTFLVVRVIASNDETTSSQETLGDSVFGTLGDPVNLKSQYAECSQGQYNVLKSVNRDSVDNRPGITDGATTATVAVSTSQGDGVMRTAITTELNSQFGVTKPDQLADYVMYCLPPNTMSGIAYAYVNSWNSVYSDNWCKYLSAQMHEVGHNINLAHSGEGSSEYDDQSGMMGYSYSQNDGPLMCFNAAKMWQLEWIGSKEVEVSQIAGTSYAGELAGYIEDIEDDTVPPMVVKVDVSGDTDYYVFFNRAEGFNSGTAECQNQVCVTRKTGDGYKVSTLVAKLSAGQSYATPGGGEITVNSIDERANVFIGYGSLPPAPTLSPTPPCNGDLVVDITTDNFGSETQWTVKGSDGNLIAENDGLLSSFTTHTTDVCIMDYECYTFEITDSWGDGICCSEGDGEYTLTFDGNVIKTGGDFGSSESTDFCLVLAAPSASPTVFSSCLDDPDFVKTRGNKNQNIDRTCAYIGAGDRPWRLNKWCNKRHRGELIKDICCNTCDDVATA